LFATATLAIGPFRRSAYSKGFDHFIRFDLTGWSIERTGMARCSGNETRAASTKKKPAEGWPKQNDEQRTAERAALVEA
jgi:hypothetical protein